MKKINKILLIALVVIVPFLSQAQFKSDEARKSLVRIYVRVPGADKQNICSGFLWKKNSWVVTSLHGMKAGANINVLYPGKEIRPAKIIKVMKDPDLVLLETSNSDGSALTLKGEAVPLTSYGASEKNNILHALGYWSDASSSQVIDIKHADFNPEKLDGILPEKYKKQLVEMTFPSIHDDIYGLNGGSLLPGFSGSPVYNGKGELVAIGDGGIEAGALNVSWSIPASNLARLEASTTSELPASMMHVPFLFSAEVSVPVTDDAQQEATPQAASEPGNEQDSLLMQSTDHYDSFKHDNLSFYQTKRRSFEEMKRTTLDTSNLQGLVRLITWWNVKLKYQDYNFDVYQLQGDGSDNDPGFVLTLPSGSNLHYDDAVNMFGVDLKELPAGEFFELYYYKEKHHGNPVKEIVSSITDKIGTHTKGLKEDTTFTKNYTLNDNWKQSYLYFTGNEQWTKMNDSVKRVYDSANLKTSWKMLEKYMFSIEIYLNIIYNDSIAFYSVAISYSQPNNDGALLVSLFKPLDCIDLFNRNISLEEYNKKNNKNISKEKFEKKCKRCEFYESMVKTFAAAHLTTVNVLH